MSKRLTNAAGNIMELYEPPYSGTELRAGHCPGCHAQTAGYVGRCAAVREVSPDGVVMSGSNYGHYDCVSALYDKMASNAIIINVPDTVPDELRWIEGTQQEFIFFMRDNQGVTIICDFNYDRHKSHRYRWRLENDL